MEGCQEDKIVMDCSKVYAKDAGNQKGVGVFAKQDFKTGDVVEFGIVRRLNEINVSNPYVFQWSEDKTVWAFGSGCSTFYNTEPNPNTQMKRFFQENKFQILAKRDIKANEELTFAYIDVAWNECYADIRSNLQ